MFLIREIDQILENVVTLSSNKKRQGAEKLQISLEDVKRISVEDLQLFSKVPYPVGPSSNVILDDMFKPKGIDDFNKLLPREKQATTDGVFASLMIPAIASKLTESKQYQYPYSKLVISDRLSYDLLLKFQKVFSVSGGSNSKNILYKTPFDVTAIFLLDDLVELLDREGEQVYHMKYEATLKRNVATYNYSIVRKSIPFLKVSDLLIILHNKGNLELGKFDMYSSREHQLIQLFSHFSRTSQLIELKSITKLIGIPQLMYNNVLKIQHLPDSSESEKSARLGFSKPSLSCLSSMAETLIQVANRLSLSLASITCRINDTHNQTKMFTELISMALNSSRTSRVMTGVPARVLVIDRFHDLRGPLLHADRYGSFLDQEKQIKTLGERSLQFRIDTVGELDEKLQLDQLTEVLSSIINYSVNLRPKDPFNSGRSKPVSPMKYEPSLAMTNSQSICRHLDRIKTIYKCLSEGYLFIIRLESNLEGIAREVCGSIEPFSNEEKITLVDRVQRAVSALKQLIKISGKSIGVLDMVRVACILIDVVNIFLYQIKIRNQSTSNKSLRSLKDMKSTFLRSKKFKKFLKPMVESNEEETKSLNRIINSLDSFDRVSQENCQYASALSLEQLVEKFCSSELVQDAAYTTIDLTKDLDLRDRKINKEVVILAFLGSLSAYELSRLKAFETSLKKKKQSHKILILVCDILIPEDFLDSL